MTKIYCDCCGKEMTNQKTRRVGRDIPILCNPGYGQMNKKLDICIECDKAFADFWRKQSHKQEYDPLINTILFDDALDAEGVLDVLEDTAYKYEYATKADFLQASGLLDDLEPDEIRVLDRYGWNKSDIVNARVMKDSSTYHIVIAPARRLND